MSNTAKVVDVINPQEILLSLTNEEVQLEEVEFDPIQFISDGEKLGLYLRHLIRQNF
jgi:hypothetical protein